MQNEKESVQIAVLATKDTLRKVAVCVGDLAGPGVRSSSTRTSTATWWATGAKIRPPSLWISLLVGWWPDPILKGLGPVDIAAGDLQAFWIRLRAPKGQRAGVYLGTATVSAEGLTPVVLDLKARVRRFALPDLSPLPLAITFSPEDNPIPQTQREQAEWRKSEDTDPRLEET